MFSEGDPESRHLVKGATWVGVGLAAWFQARTQGDVTSTAGLQRECEREPVQREGSPSNRQVPF